MTAIIATGAMANCAWKTKNEKFLESIDTCLDESFAYASKQDHKCLNVDVIWFKDVEKLQLLKVLRDDINVFTDLGPFLIKNKSYKVEGDEEYAKSFPRTANEKVSSIDRTNLSNSYIKMVKNGEELKKDEGLRKTLFDLNHEETSTAKTANATHLDSTSAKFATTPSTMNNTTTDKDSNTDNANTVNATILIMNVIVILQFHG